MAETPNPLDGPVQPTTESEQALRILLVDDDAALRGVTAARLRKTGFVVDVAADGQEALTVARAEAPDVIVSDIMMPRMDGMELLRRVRDDSALRHCYVILLTAKDRTTDVVEGLDASADDYLTKPFNMAALMARIRAGARLKRAQDALRLSNERLREALRHWSDLLGIAIHDLRSPVSIITTYTSMLGSGVVDEAAVKEVVLRRSQGLIELLDSLLDASKIQAGRVRLEAPELFDLAVPLREALDLYEPVARKSEIALVPKIQGPAEVEASRQRMTEILTTLLDSALRLTKSKTPVRVELGRSADHVEMAVCLTPSDPHPDLPQQLMAPRSDTPTGADARTLVGLAIVRKLVEMMRGTVQARLQGRELQLGFRVPAAG